MGHDFRKCQLDNEGCQKFMKEKLKKIHERNYDIIHERNHEKVHAEKTMIV